jgi:uncharacterized membrane protein YgaE (UPF0421/DUF939 family)
MSAHSHSPEAFVLQGKENFSKNEEKKEKLDEGIQLQNAEATFLTKVESLRTMFDTLFDGNESETAKKAGGLIDQLTSKSKESSHVLEQVWRDIVKKAENVITQAEGGKFERGTLDTSEG